MIILRGNEDQLIDSYRPQADATAPIVVQAANIGHDLQTVGGVKVPELPDPAIMGQNASGRQNGYSVGFFGRRATRAPFMGAMAKPPAITNAVQGNVGVNNRASKLWAGVMDQLVQYTPNQGIYAATYVGAVDPTTRIVAGVKK